MLFVDNSEGVTESRNKWGAGNKAFREPYPPLIIGLAGLEAPQVRPKYPGIIHPLGL